MNARTPAPDILQAPMSLDGLFEACEQLQKAGQPTQALALYASWLATSQDDNRHMAWFNYGAALQAAGQPLEAIKAYVDCLSLQPYFPQALINMGLTLEKLGKREEALQQWVRLASQRLLKDAPATEFITTAFNHIGRVQEDLKQYDMAEQALTQSLALNPKQPGVIQHWIHIRQKACKWPVYQDLPGISRNDMLMYTSPLAMLALTDDPVQQLLTAHAFVARTYGLKEEFLCKGRAYAHPRKRIGYVSGDLCVHAVGLLLAELLEGHDKAKFEIYGYDFSPEDGTAHRARLKKTFDHLRPVHLLADREVAELILQDEIDVLIDLHGLSAGARPGIFALHPAPKQGTYLGFIGTTGMPWFDFVIADRYALPDELTPYFTEKPLYVNGSFIPLTRDETPVRQATRAEFGLPEDAFVMAAFGNVYKITEEMFNVWLNILDNATNSILWLIDDNQTTTNQLKLYARNRGIELNRIIFTSRSAHDEYLAKLRVADVFLDTFPYNCGSTTSDVITAGLPMVTMSGKTLVSRMGGSILHAVNRMELITESFEDYALTVTKLCTSKNTPKPVGFYLVNKTGIKASDIEKSTDNYPFSEINIQQHSIKYQASEKVLKQPILSLITHHYNGNSAAKKLVAHLEAMPTALTEQIEIIIIDDYSDIEENIKSNLNFLKQFRITDDIPWNQAGARNLGAIMAKSNWALFFDIDQLPSQKGLTEIMNYLKLADSEILYYFNVDNFIDSNLEIELPIHPNTFMVNLERFKSTCMYDEDFAGHYGYEDLYLPYVWEFFGGKRQVFGNTAYFTDQKNKTMSLNRSLEINKLLAHQKISDGIKKPKNLIRFNWKKM